MQGRVLLISDYKQKVLPGKHRETQQEGFGKRGKSLWGTTALRWDSRAQDFEVLNIRIACDDAKQTWFHSLNCMTVTLDELTKAWGSGLDCDLLSDGASNYTCTAFGTSLPRIFKVAGHKIDQHVISEVGGGKNLTDTDFVHVQRSLDYEKESGGAHEDAQQIFDALENHGTQGTVNAGMDLEGRKNEPKAPKPYSGIDDKFYHRKYIYNDAGEWIGMQLHQFFRLGEGKFVSKGVLRSLWRSEELNVDTLKPKRLVPSGGESIATTKMKESESHAAQTAWVKRRKRWEREHRKLETELREAAAERLHAAQLTAFHCSFAAAGCRHRPFLSKHGAHFHEKFACPWAQERASCDDEPGGELGARAAAAVAKRSRRSLDSACVNASVRVWSTDSRAAWARFDGSRPVRVKLQVSREGKVKLHATLVTPESHPVTIRLKAHRPLREQPGQQYGLQEFRGGHQSAEAQMVARSTYSGRVTVSLSTWRFSAEQLPGGERVEPKVGVSLGVGRTPTQQMGKGWAIRPPAEYSRYTTEQRNYLEEIVFQSAERLGDEQRFEKFKLKFNQASGPYARALRLSRKQIKGWASSENRKRQMGAARGAAAEADDEADDDEAGAAAQANPPPQTAAAPVARATNVGVKEMRAEMRQLGCSAAEVNAPKGRAAVLAALVALRVNPQLPAPAQTDAAAPALAAAAPIPTVPTAPLPTAAPTVVATAAAATPTDDAAPALAATAPIPTVPTAPLPTAAPTVVATVVAIEPIEPVIPPTATALTADGGNVAEGLGNDEEYEEEVEVEDIVDMRRRRGIEEFRVRWEGCAAHRVLSASSPVPLM